MLKRKHEWKKILAPYSSSFLKAKKLKYQKNQKKQNLTYNFFFQITDGGGGMLTPPDKLNGDHHNPHWASSSLTMAGSMQTPPSLPPMSIERFG